MKALLLTITSLLLLSGCSNKAIYESVQINNRNECTTLPADQFEECMKQANKSYEEYERERKELLEDDQ